MAKTITQLPDATSVSASDEMIIQQSGVTKRATVAELMVGGSASLPAGTVVSGSSASAALRVTQTGAGDALLVEDDTNPDATPLVVNNVGQIISGATTAFDADAGLQITADSASAPNANMVLQRCMDSSGNAVIRLVRTRGSLSSQTAVQDGDSFGAVVFQGWNAAGAPATGARILAACDGSLGASDMPGRITFNTTASGGTGAGTERMRIDSAGNVGIGTTANAAALLDVSSTTKGFLPPRMTTTERNAISTPPAGLMVYNTTTNKINFYNGTAWEAVTSS